MADNSSELSGIYHEKRVNRFAFLAEERLPNEFYCI
jgi:hypothetical protein